MVEGLRMGYNRFNSGNGKHRLGTCRFISNNMGMCTQKAQTSLVLRGGERRCWWGNVETASL